MRIVSRTSSLVRASYLHVKLFQGIFTTGLQPVISQSHSSEMEVLIHMILGIIFCTLVVTFIQGSHKHFTPEQVYLWNTNVLVT